MGGRPHGQCANPVYGIWNAMMHRCSNPKVKQYTDYGGRGISVCARWHDVRLFIEDMGPRPEGYTLERRNNDGNYEPSNCYWATWTEQAFNRRLLPKKNHIRVMLGGKSITLSEARRLLNLNRKDIHRRARRITVSNQQAFDHVRNLKESTHA